MWLCCHVTLQLTEGLYYVRLAAKILTHFNFMYCYISNSTLMFSHCVMLYKKGAEGLKALVVLDSPNDQMFDKILSNLLFGCCFFLTADVSTSAVIASFSAKGLLHLSHAEWCECYYYYFTASLFYFWNIKKCACNTLMFSLFNSNMVSPRKHECVTMDETFDLVMLGHTSHS